MKLTFVILFAGLMASSSVLAADYGAAVGSQPPKSGLPAPTGKKPANGRGSAKRDLHNIADYAVYRRAPEPLPPRGTSNAPRGGRIGTKRDLHDAADYTVYGRALKTGLPPPTGSKPYRGRGGAKRDLHEAADDVVYKRQPLPLQTVPQPNPHGVSSKEF